ncbi:hypothetical protein [Arthrobacter sp. AZCC_0090]|uniref:hypothetical protein n=1 Tax=Arthrobacter sp. AZCC_0090 TaxID=2735881 RepID=UPI0016127420|nr:hypothetical protein [Arthrobacter sp. AZCC_0090]MBB6403342.1 hypothetical protein [Arthrobacter sp. AZCC_0090]
MFTLQIEHAVNDFAAWKRSFDSDPADRAGSGVVSYRVCRPVNDSQRVLIELDFAERDHAESMLNTLRTRVWSGPGRPASLDGMPDARIVESVEARTL